MNEHWLKIKKIYLLLILSLKSSIKKINNWLKQKRRFNILPNDD
jgi:hypothetical protein